MKKGKFYVCEVHDGRVYYLTQRPHLELKLLHGPYKSYDYARKKALQLNKKGASK